MDDILERLLSSAEETFGAERALELKPFLEQAASDLHALSQHKLEPADGA
jgi:hypothetical protein